MTYRLVEAVDKVMLEMIHDDIILDALIDIEVGTIEEYGNIHLLPSAQDGSQPSAHDGSQPSGDALALYGGGKPGQPADIVLDEPDEHLRHETSSGMTNWHEIATPVTWLSKLAKLVKRKPELSVIFLKYWIASVMNNSALECK